MLRNLLLVFLLAVIFNSLLPAQSFQKNNTYLINAKKNKTESFFKIENFQNAGQISRNVYFGLKLSKSGYERIPEIISPYKDRINLFPSIKMSYKQSVKPQYSDSEFLYQKRHMSIY